MSLSVIVFIPSIHSLSRLKWKFSITSRAERLLVTEIFKWYEHVEPFLHRLASPRTHQKISKHCNCGEMCESTITDTPQNHLFMNCSLICVHHLTFGEISKLSVRVNFVTTTISYSLSCTLNHYISYSLGIENILPLCLGNLILS